MNNNTNELYEKLAKKAENAYKDKLLKLSQTYNKGIEGDLASLNIELTDKVGTCITINSYTMLEQINKQILKRNLQREIDTEITNFLSSVDRFAKQLNALELLVGQDD